MNLDHVAIAVRSLEEAAPRLCETLGYRVRTEPVNNSRHQVNVQFLCKEGSLDIKLIEPAGDDSPLWEFVKQGGGLHHLCFKVDDVREGCRDMVAKKVRVISRPAPGEAFDDHLIAFCYLGLGVNMELIDTDARRALVQLQQ
jgi:methylmalonyl-CoA/ethylmalonyl-CoA epimerase